MRRDAADNSRIIIARTALRRAPCRVAFLQLSESGTHTEKQGLCGRSAAVWILWSDYYSFLQKKLMRALLSGTERRDITGPPLLPEKQNKQVSLPAAHLSAVHSFTLCLTILAHLTHLHKLCPAWLGLKLGGRRMWRLSCHVFWATQQESKPPRWHSGNVFIQGFISNTWRCAEVVLRFILSVGAFLFRVYTKSWTSSFCPKNSEVIKHGFMRWFLPRQPNKSELNQVMYGLWLFKGSSAAVRWKSNCCK